MSEARKEAIISNVKVNNLAKEVRDRVYNDGGNVVVVVHGKETHNISLAASGEEVAQSIKSLVQSYPEQAGVALAAMAKEDPITTSLILLPVMSVVSSADEQENEQQEPETSKQQ